MAVGTQSRPRRQEAENPVDRFIRDNEGQFSPELGEPKPMRRRSALGVIAATAASVLGLGGSAAKGEVVYKERELKSQTITIPEEGGVVIENRSRLHDFEVVARRGDRIDRLVCIGNREIFLPMGTVVHDNSPNAAAGARQLAQNQKETFLTPEEKTYAMKQIGPEEQERTSSQVATLKRDARLVLPPGFRLQARGGESRTITGRDLGKVAVVEVKPSEAEKKAKTEEVEKKRLTEAKVRELKPKVDGLNRRLKEREYQPNNINLSLNPETGEVNVTGINEAVKRDEGEYRIPPGPSRVIERKNKATGVWEPVHPDERNYHIAILGWAGGRMPVEGEGDLKPIIPKPIFRPRSPPSGPRSAYP